MAVSSWRNSCEAMLSGPAARRSSTANRRRMRAWYSVGASWYAASPSFRGRLALSPSIFRVTACSSSQAAALAAPSVLRSAISATCGSRGSSQKRSSTISPTGKRSKIESLFWVSQRSMESAPDRKEEVPSVGAAMDSAEICTSAAAPSPSRPSHASMRGLSACRPCSRRSRAALEAAATAACSLRASAAEDLSCSSTPSSSPSSSASPSVPAGVSPPRAVRGAGWSSCSEASYRYGSSRGTSCGASWCSTASWRASHRSRVATAMAARASHWSPKDSADCIAARSS
mmetsp:Transcript_11006/g.32967  ORF Transcript_11006/g.32967 Transcript_11006/m.32967 type:complete len:287 (-) Transcript_11006:1069-1929(-)